MNGEKRTVSVERPGMVISVMLNSSSLPCGE